MPDQASSCEACGAVVFSTPDEKLTVYDPVTEAPSEIDIMTDATGCCKCAWLTPACLHVCCKLVGAGDIAAYPSQHPASALYQVASHDSNQTSCSLCQKRMVVATPLLHSSIILSLTAACCALSCNLCDNTDIKAGQGLYATEVDGQLQFYARNCDNNTYGVKSLTYGLTPYACRSCPQGMVTSKDKVNYPNSASYYVDNGDGTGGFVDVRACVTQAGYGYSARQAYACAAGTYNDKDNWKPCTACPFGTTTADVGQGVTEADCKLAPGFGFYEGQVQFCPVGESSG